MKTNGDPVVETYSKLADVYDDPANLESCWGRIADHSLSLVSVRDTHRTIVDIGCGTGRELSRLASRHPLKQFFGVEPAANMRKLAAVRAAQCSNVGVLAGRFESLTYYDTLEGHWAWWVRIEGQFVNIPADKRAECDRAVRAALAALETPEGIPYTVHLLHVRLRRS